MPHRESAPAQLQDSSTPNMGQLVSALSHDLTANLFVLEASLKQLKKTCDDAPIGSLAQNFAQVDACLRESKRFLDDLRLLSRSGQVQTESCRLELSRLIADVLEEQAPLLRVRKIRVEVGKALPAIWCNEVRAKQVLTNLIRNAALHGCEARQPRIRIEASEHSLAGRKSAEGGAGRWTWIRVSDNGPGIPVESHESVFAVGARLPGATAEGSGLGLAIVRQTVAQFGGEVWIDGAAAGTTFVFSLPAPALPTPHEGTQELPVPHLFRSPVTERLRSAR